MHAPSPSELDARIRNFVDKKSRQYPEITDPDMFEPDEPVERKHGLVSRLFGTSNLISQY